MPTGLTLQTLPKKVYTIVYPAEKRAFGFRAPHSERHAVLAFVQRVDAEQVARGIEATSPGWLPESDLEIHPNAIKSIVLAPATKHRLSFLRVDSHESLEDMYLNCQTNALDLNICTDVSKSKTGYEFHGTLFDVPDNFDVFRNALRAASQATESWD